MFECIHGLIPKFRCNHESINLVSIDMAQVPAEIWTVSSTTLTRETLATRRAYCTAMSKNFQVWISLNKVMCTLNGR